MVRYFFDNSESYSLQHFFYLNEEYFLYKNIKISDIQSKNNYFENSLVIHLLKYNGTHLKKLNGTIFFLNFRNRK